MTIHHHARRLLRPVAFTAGVAVLGAMALSSQAASPAPWRALFPVAAAYPHGTHLLRMQSATRPSALVDAVTAMQATHLGFGRRKQDAVLPHQAVASVTVLVFRTERGAATFVREDHPTALANPNTPGTAVDGLGYGARYISGSLCRLRDGRPTPGYPDPVPWHGRGADPDPAAGPRSGPTPGSHRPGTGDADVAPCGRCIQ